MGRYEYRVIWIDSRVTTSEALTNQLNELGHIGWELVSVDSGPAGLVLYLKRRIG